ncbi:aldehyde dehydrogenase family protein [Nocardia sp. CA2R105]|uniref:aldehyde dehydrogenase family protein n=1 Tax=Nocardia coffeae TaxID=2873381 RepID=UPI001CA69370|nr:aldehyde dehydrogenase family protein [Nocardia coffeae]MBY8856852.1 aldehyde dehydrogenase family protein [Nocardia coffeae]
MTALDTVVDFPHYIDGEFREAHAGGWIDSVNPATGRTWARIPAGAAADIDAAVSAAHRAARAWRNRTAADRAGVLRRLAVVVRDHAEELWRVESTDNGRAVAETRPAVLGAAMQIEFHAGLAETITGQTVSLAPSALTYSALEPYGVVGVIIPWNAPLAMFLAKVSAALAAGNGVVVKPPERASVSILIVARLLEDAGIPPGLVNIVCGEGAAAGEALVDHPDVAKVGFTGSTATGRRITARSTGNMKALSLELGGKSPNIVFADADLDAAAAGVAAGIFTGSAGQACIAGSRILVQDSIFDDLLERVRDIAGQIVLGDPLDSSTGMGPLAFDQQYAKVCDYLDLGVAEGARRVFGGRTAPELFQADNPLRNGYFVEPTLFATEDNGLRICQEEIFGPVAVAVPFSSDEQAVELANGTAYGLAAGVWSRDLGRVHRMAGALRAGTVWVNTYRRLHWALPFGGHKQSGNGVSNGPHALHEWLEHKSVWIEHGV